MRAHDALPARRRLTTASCWPGGRPWTWACRTGSGPPASWTRGARADLLAASELVVLPSPHESLSLVALEAWSAGRPTLATGRSEVLAGQTARSSGGLLYVDDLSYSRQMSRLAADPSLRDMLGTRGARFAGEWTWEACVRRWRGLLAQVRAPVGAGSVRG